MTYDTELEYKLKVLEFVKDYKFSKVVEERNLLTAEYYANLGTDHQIPLPSNLPGYPTTEDILLMAEVINRHIGL